jgi:hypothetical protein
MFDNAFQNMLSKAQEAQPQAFQEAQEQAQPQPSQDAQVQEQAARIQEQAARQARQALLAQRAQEQAAKAQEAAQALEQAKGQPSQVLMAVLEAQKGLETLLEPCPSCGKARKARHGLTSASKAGRGRPWAFASCGEKGHPTMDLEGRDVPRALQDTFRAGLTPSQQEARSQAWDLWRAGGRGSWTDKLTRSQAMALLTLYKADDAALGRLRGQLAVEALPAPAVKAGLPFEGATQMVQDPRALDLAASKAKARKALEAFLVAPSAESYLAAAQAGYAHLEAFQGR